MPCRSLVICPPGFEVYGIWKKSQPKGGEKKWEGGTPGRKVKDRPLFQKFLKKRGGCYKIIKLNKEIAGGGRQGDSSSNRGTQIMQDGNQQILVRVSRGADKEGRGTWGGPVRVLRKKFFWGLGAIRCHMGMKRGLRKTKEKARGELADKIHNPGGLWIMKGIGANRSKFPSMEKKDTRNQRGGREWKGPKEDAEQGKKQSHVWGGGLLTGLPCGTSNLEMIRRTLKEVKREVPNLQQQKKRLGFQIVENQERLYHAKGETRKRCQERTGRAQNRNQEGMSKGLRTRDQPDPIQKKSYHKNCNHKFATRAASLGRKNPKSRGKRAARVPWGGGDRSPRGL